MSLPFEAGESPQGTNGSGADKNSGAGVNETEKSGTERADNHRTGGEIRHLPNAIKLARFVWAPTLPPGLR